MLATYGLCLLVGFYDGMGGVKAGCTIRAVVIEDGHTNFDVSHFKYVIDRHTLTCDTSAEILPGDRMVLDPFNDKMCLILFCEAQRGRSMLVPGSRCV